MVIELDPGTQHGGRGAGRAARSRSRRRCPTSTSTRSSSSLDARHARLPAAAAQRRRRGRSSGNGHATLSRDAPALRADRALHARDQRARSRSAARNIAPRRSTTSRCSPTALGAKDDAARATSSTRPTRSSRRFADQDANLRATLQLLPGALHDDATRRWPRSTTLADVLGPTLGALRPGARALGPSLRADAPVPARDDADHPEPAAAVRARRAADGQGAAPGAARPRGRHAGPHDARSRCSTACSTSSPTTRRASEEGYLFWPSWAQPRRRDSLFSTQDAHGPIRRGLVVAVCYDAAACCRRSAAPNPQLGTLGRRCSNAPDHAADLPGPTARAPTTQPAGADGAEASPSLGTHPRHGRASRCPASACCCSCGSRSAAPSRSSRRATASSVVRGGRRSSPRRPTCGSPA